MKNKQTEMKDPNCCLPGNDCCGNITDMGCC